MDQALASLRIETARKRPMEQHKRIRLSRACGLKQPGRVNWMDYRAIRLSRACGLKLCKKTILNQHEGSGSREPAD